MERKQVNRQRYIEMLEVLPPADWTSIGFLVGEPVDHNAEGLPRYQAFTEHCGKFYEYTEPMTVREFRKLTVETNEWLRGYGSGNRSDLNDPIGGTH